MTLGGGRDARGAASRKRLLYCNVSTASNSNSTSTT